MLVPMMLVSGRWLNLDPLTVVPLVMLAVAPIVGLGFLMGGLALLYKRVENLFGIITFGFVGLITAPVEQFELLKLLPLAQGSHLT
jgi:ABC-2 type transport system permease protein